MTSREMLDQLGYEKGLVLIDTHVLVWAALAPEKLSPLAKAILEWPNYQIAVSSASALELWRKQHTGKLDFLASPDAGTAVELALEWTRHLQMTWLAIDAKDVLAMARLPWIHKDPFDRMLIAQAVARCAPLVSKDETIHRYANANVDPAMLGRVLEILW